jgi:bifunctional UDP-N-acetylglucosamine pyrophosphorylase/glucosamine-1-phosphate N-acetyltransferase
VTHVLVVPAAGRGSRLGASAPKALLPVNGRPMLDYLADLYAPVVTQMIVVAHPSFSASIEQWGRRYGNVSVAEQASPTGMLDAILAAASLVRRLAADTIWITWGDQIGVLPATVSRLAALSGGSSAGRPARALPTVSRRDPYIHFERDSGGRIVRLRQRREGDVMPAEGESDIGLFALSRAAFEEDLREYARDVPPGSATGERNFVPFVPWLAHRRTVETFSCTHPQEAVGVNTPEELAEMSAWLRSRTAPS